MDLNIKTTQNSSKIKLIELGFISCGISKADFLEEEAPRLEKWLNQNLNGKWLHGKKLR